MSALVRHFEEGKSRGNSGEEPRDDRFENSVVLRSRRKIHRVGQHDYKLLFLVEKTGGVFQPPGCGMDLLQNLHRFF